MKVGKKLFASVVMSLSAALVSYAQQSRDEIAESAAVLCGAASLEDLDEQVLDHYERLARHPLHINSASAHSLAASGMFSPYQIASLADYRSLHGDILSFTELSTLNGFGETFAGALKAFVSLDSSRPAGSLSEDAKLETELLERFCAKGESGGAQDFSYGSKLRVAKAGKMSLGLTARRPYGADAALPSSWTGSLALKGRKTQLILGDFNARFGQGLVWRSGFALAGFGSVTAFSVNPTGLSAAWSYSSPGRGAAASLELGKLELSTALACARDKSGSLQLSPLLNASLFLGGGQMGITLCREAVSADTRFNTGRFDWFGELAYCIPGAVPAMVSGMVFNPSYQHKLGLRFRYYPESYKVSTAAAAGATTRSSDEIGLTLGYQTPALTTTLDVMERPSDGSWNYKAVMTYLLSGESPWSLALRLTERFNRSADLPFKTDLRTQLGYESGAWQHALRVNGLICRNTGLLAYGESGWHNTDESGRYELKLYGRLALFDIDHWDDRIYVYERDAPGNFSSRAFCGRGWNAQLFGGITHRARARRRYSLYAKLMLQDCTREEAHDRRMVELRIQAMMQF